MKITRISGLDLANKATVEKAFACLPPHPIACCNWAAQYPYAPEVTFRMFHTGTFLMLRFDVHEACTAALVEQDNGAVWTDSCVEFFLSVCPNEGDADNGYYNFETSAIGHMLLGYRHTRHDAVHAPESTLRLVKRATSLPFGQTFSERKGDNRWHVTLAIPAEALFHHTLHSWDGVKARMNLYKCGDNLSLPHFLSWKPIRTPKPNFHCPEYFESVEFTAE